MWCYDKVCLLLWHSVVYVIVGQCVLYNGKVFYRLLWDSVFVVLCVTWYYRTVYLLLWDSAIIWNCKTKYKTVCYMVLWNSLFGMELCFTW